MTRLKILNVVSNGNYIWLNGLFLLLVDFGRALILHGIFSFVVLIICYGADPNRNWDISWKEFGESSNPCSQNYPGYKQFSEPEMASIASYLKGIAESRHVDIYIAYRSYSQLLHYPWDHERRPAPLHVLWQKIGEAATNDLREVHGTQYKVGSFSQFYEPAGGVSADWFYQKYEPTISFTYEIRDTGGFGFLLPSDQIIPTGEELLTSLGRILNEYLQLNLTNPASI